MHATFRFYSINFQFNIDSPLKFCVFLIGNSSNVTQRSVSPGNPCREKKAPSPFSPAKLKAFFFFLLLLKTISGFSDSKVEFKVTAHYIL